MEFTSILDLRESPDRNLPRPALYGDLNLDQVIGRAAGSWGEATKKLYYHFPADEECETYRREVFADVKRPSVRQTLLEFTEKMELWKDARERKRKVREEVQGHVWHIVETSRWCGALEGLAEGLAGEDCRSGGLCLFRKYLQEYLDSEDYREMRAGAVRLHERLCGFRLRLTYEKELLAVSEEQTKGTYEAFLKERFPTHGRELKNPFTAEEGLSILEYEVIKIFRKKHEDFFREAASFHEAHRECAREKLLLFGEEIKFYLSFAEFRDKMQERGFAFAAPDARKDREMYATGLYDLALACVNAAEQKEVVSNDVHFSEGERFFVLTGPNQGGKTTFARSLGQLVYFARMGLDVPAASANVPHFGKLLTHFSVEESVETGRGKLKEELVRLAPMMEENETGAFVVINELFTTAANYDACIMGKRVLEHFIGQGCRGIYVTHLKELAEERPGVVSLRATLDERKVQTFRILRSEAEESACAVNQVNKYQLTYSQLKERLS